MKPCVVAFASRMDCTSVVTHVDAAYSRSSHASVVSTTLYCGQSRPWQNLRAGVVVFTPVRALSGSRKSGDWTWPVNR